MPLRRPSSLRRPSHIRGSGSITDIPLLPFDQRHDDYSYLTEAGYTPPPTAEYNSSFGLASPPFLRHGPESGDNEEESSDGIIIRHNYLDLNWCLFIITLACCGATSYFAYNATLETPDPLFIPEDPNQTIGILNAMSTICAFLLGELVQAVFERTRWILASRSKGLSMTDFLGMSRATSIVGVFALLFWSKGKKSYRNSGSNSSIWIVKRYLF